MKRLYVSAGILAITAASIVVNAVPASASGGNSANAHACQQGGWQNVTRADLSPFASQGDCVSYGAQGGSILVSVTLSPSSVTTSTASSDTQATVTANFANGSSADVTLMTNVTWISSNHAVALLLPGGDIHPVSVGTTEIYVTYGPFTSNTMTFAVTS